jgi:signal transduction histidine kinase
VFEFLKHITPKTKILSLSLFLILLPGAVISYLSLSSIGEKAEDQRVKYLGTAALVRDKLENELNQLCYDLRNNVLDSLALAASERDVQRLLGHLEKSYPAFTGLFVVKPGGGLINGVFTLGCGGQETNGCVSALESDQGFRNAERAEFIEKDIRKAIRAYARLYEQSASDCEKVTLLHRMGRNHYKGADYLAGIKSYREILQYDGEKAFIGRVPASAVALSQIALGHKRLGDDSARRNALIDLYAYLLHRPWDLEGWDYTHYLRNTGQDLRQSTHEVDNYTGDTTGLHRLQAREDEYLELSDYMALIHRYFTHDQLPGSTNPGSADIQTIHLQAGTGSSLELAYFRLPPEILDPELVCLGFELDQAHILSEYFPGILSTVTLGRENSLGILNDRDGVIWYGDRATPGSYLVAENFTSFFPAWKVGLFDKSGKTVEQLAGREKRLYFFLFAGILAVMAFGIIILARAVLHETEASRLKSEFVSNVTHELKTPLALIRMFGETLDSGMVTDEHKRKEFYSIIRKESERLSHLIENVLDFSRMDAGNKEYSFGETDLVQLIRHSLEAYRYHIRDRGFTVEHSFPEYPVMLSLDEDAISQAFLNILSNAVRYSDARKYIRVEILTEGSSILLKVVDHGIGINRNEQGRIFDKFYRVSDHSEGFSAKRGSGLGLTLSKHIIEAHGGNIRVESEPGQGSSFTIVLPISEEQASKTTRHEK